MLTVKLCKTLCLAFRSLNHSSWNRLTNLKINSVSISAIRLIIIELLSYFFLAQTHLFCGTVWPSLSRRFESPFQCRSWAWLCPKNRSLETHKYKIELLLYSQIKKVEFTFVLTQKGLSAHSLPSNINVRYTIVL